MINDTVFTRFQAFVVIRMILIKNGTIKILILKTFQAITNTSINLKFFD